MNAGESSSSSSNQSPAPPPYHSRSSRFHEEVVDKKAEEEDEMDAIIDGLDSVPPEEDTSSSSERLQAALRAAQAKYLSRPEEPSNHVPYWKRPYTAEELEMDDITERLGANAVSVRDRSAPQVDGTNSAAATNVAAANPGPGEPGWFNMSFFKPSRKPFLHRPCVLLIAFFVIAGLVIGAGFVGHEIHPRIVHVVHNNTITATVTATQTQTSSVTTTRISSETTTQRTTSLTTFLTKVQTTVRETVTSTNFNVVAITTAGSSPTAFPSNAAPSIASPSAK